MGLTRMLKIVDSCVLLRFGSLRRVQTWRSSRRTPSRTWHVRSEPSFSAALLYNNFEQPGGL